MTDTFIMVAPNGARRGKADHPKLPLAIDEIVATARACFDAGVDGLHLHVRDQSGQHSLDPGRYGEALAELTRAVPLMKVQTTTEAAGLYSVDDQLRCLAHLRPAWASVSVREIARAPDLAAKVYDLCAANGTEIQHILYDRSDLALYHQWRATSTIPKGRDSLLFVLGRYAPPTPAAPDDLSPFHQDLRPGTRWMACAFGPREQQCLLRAARLGGDVRVGFENSLTDAQGAFYPDNAASVRRLVAQLRRTAA